MNTMGKTAAAAAILLLAGCGTAHSSGQAAKTADPEPVAAGQSLESWIPASAAILQRLTGDLTDIRQSLSADPASVQAGVDRLTADATAGVDLKAPAGHPEIDRAWDAVMNDYLLVSGDLSGGDAAQASVDLDATTADIAVFQRAVTSL